MLRQAVPILLLIVTILSPVHGANKALEQFEKLASKFECKGEKLNIDVTMSLMNKKCKKELGSNLACVYACHLKSIGLFEDDYRLSEDDDKLVERMANTKAMSKKLARMFVDSFKGANCPSKSPPKGNDSCTKAFKGAACVVSKLNKFCNAGWDKLISSNL